MRSGSSIAVNDLRLYPNRLLESDRERLDGLLDDLSAAEDLLETACRLGDEMSGVAQKVLERWSEEKSVLGSEMADLGKAVDYYTEWREYGGDS